MFRLVGVLQILHVLQIELHQTVVFDVQEFDQIYVVFKAVNGKWRLVLLLFELTDARAPVRYFA